MTAFANFIFELRSSPVYASIADDWATAFRELDHEAVHSKDIREFRKGVFWIMSQPRTIEEKIAAIEKFCALGPSLVVIGSMRFLCGW